MSLGLCKHTSPFTRVRNIVFDPEKKRVTQEENDPGTKMTHSKLSSVNCIIYPQRVLPLQKEKRTKVVRLRTVACSGKT